MHKRQVAPPLQLAAKVARGDTLQQSEKEALVETLQLLRRRRLRAEAQASLKALLHPTRAIINRSP